MRDPNKGYLKPEEHFKFFNLINRLRRDGHIEAANAVKEAYWPTKLRS